MAEQNQSFIGVALSGGKVRAAVVDGNGSIVTRREAELTVDNLVNQVAGIARELAAGTPRIQAVGIAIPGLVNRQTDSVIISRYVPSTVRGNLHAEFTDAIGLRVEIENDANA